MAFGAFYLQDTAGSPERARWSRSGSQSQHAMWLILPARRASRIIKAYYRLISHGQFESQENKKLCFCPSSLALDERLDGQNLLFQHCMIKIFMVRTTALIQPVLGFKSVGHFQVLFVSVLIRVQVQNLSFENEFCMQFHFMQIKVIFIRMVSDSDSP